jgi:hypothetical protein
LEIELKNIILRRVSIFEFLHSQGQSRKLARLNGVSVLPSTTDLITVRKHPAKTARGSFSVQAA